MSASEVVLECQRFFKLCEQMSVNGSVILDKPFFHFFSHFPFYLSLLISLCFSLSWRVKCEAFEKVVDKNSVDVLDFASLLNFMRYGQLLSPVRFP